MAYRSFLRLIVTLFFLSVLWAPVGAQVEECWIIDSVVEVREECPKDRDFLPVVSSPQYLD